MKRITFYGGSDDNFGYRINGKYVDSYDNCAREKAIIYKVSDGINSVLVVGHYWLTNGTWAIGISQVNENQLLPEWAKNVQFGVDSNGYSVTMTIEVPDEASVYHVKI